MARERLTRTERRARTRADLLDAAATVFVERGFQATSVEAVAEAAGYTRGAFYSNFTSKNELFAELLQDRVYGMYRQIAEESASRADRPSLKALGEQLAEIQADPEGRWLFRLWLEMLAHAGRDDEFRRLAAGFWSGTRTLGAQAVVAAFAEDGTSPPIAGEHLASAIIALDIGLALQHFVDPEAVPLDIYPQLYGLLFEHLAEAD